MIVRPDARRRCLPRTRCSVAGGNLAGRGDPDDNGYARPVEGLIVRFARRTGRSCRLPRSGSSSAPTASSKATAESLPELVEVGPAAYRTVLPLFGEVALLGRTFMLGIPGRLGQQFIIRFLNLKLIFAGLECSLNIASAVPGNLCLGSLTYPNRLSSSVSAIPDLRHSHYRGQLLPR
jgi:hypothetical protein